MGIMDEKEKQHPDTISRDRFARQVLRARKTGDVIEGLSRPGIGKTWAVKDAAKLIAEEEGREFVDWNDLNEDEKEWLIRNPSDDRMVYINQRFSGIKPEHFTGIPDIVQENKFEYDVEFEGPDGETHEVDVYAENQGEAKENALQQVRDKTRQGGDIADVNESGQEWSLKHINYKRPRWVYYITQPDAQVLLHADEHNLSSREVRAALQKLFNPQEREIGEYALSDGVQIVATGNRPNKDDVPARELPASQVARLKNFEVYGETDQWFDWVHSLDADYEENPRRAPFQEEWLEFLESPKGEHLTEDKRISPRRLHYTSIELKYLERNGLDTPDQIYLTVASRLGIEHAKTYAEWLGDEENMNMDRVIEKAERQIDEDSEDLTYPEVGQAALRRQVQINDAIRSTLIYKGPIGSGKTSISEKEARNIAMSENRPFIKWTDLNAAQKEHLVSPDFEWADLDDEQRRAFVKADSEGVSDEEVQIALNSDSDPFYYMRQTISSLDPRHAFGVVDLEASSMGDAREKAHKEERALIDFQELPQEDQQLLLENDWTDIDDGKREQLVVDTDKDKELAVEAEREPEIYFGDSETIKFRRPPWLKLVTQDDARGVLFLDEFNLAHTSKLEPFYGLLDPGDRQIGEYRLSDGFSVGAAGNRKVDGVPVFQEKAAIEDRAKHVTVKQIDLEAFRNWIQERDAMSREEIKEHYEETGTVPRDEDLDFHPTLYAYLNGYGSGNIHVDKNEGNAVNMRSWELINRNLWLLDFENMTSPRDIEEEVAGYTQYDEGSIATDFSTYWEAEREVDFEKYLEQPEDFQDLDWEDHPVSEKWAIVNSVARKVDPEGIKMGMDDGFVETMLTGSDEVEDEDEHERQQEIIDRFSRACRLAYEIWLDRGPSSLEMSSFMNNALAEYAGGPDKAFNAAYYQAGVDDETAYELVDLALEEMWDIDPKRDLAELRDRAEHPDFDKLTDQIATYRESDQSVRDLWRDLEQLVADWRDAVHNEEGEEDILDKIETRLEQANDDLDSATVNSKPYTFDESDVDEVESKVERIEEALDEAREAGDYSDVKLIFDDLVDELGDAVAQNGLIGFVHEEMNEEVEGEAVLTERQRDSIADILEHEWDEDVAQTVYNVIRFDPLGTQVGNLQSKDLGKSLSGGSD